MCCYHPISVVDKYNRNVVRKVPCGNCIGCLQDYQNSWKIRLVDELKHYDYKGVYCTLTYDPERAISTGLEDEFCNNTPFGKLHDQNRVLTVWKEHVQSWLKRSRRKAEYYYKKPLDFTYFITSEYGPNTLRPHYHCLFMGLSVEDFERFFLPDWCHKQITKYYKTYKKGRHLWMDGISWYRYLPNKFYRGNVDYEQIVFDSNKSPEACADYVSKYCSKGFFENPRVARGDVEPTFHLVSKGVGYSALEKLRIDILGDYKECSKELDSYTYDSLMFSLYGDEFTAKDKQLDSYFGLLTNFDSKFHDNQLRVFETGVYHDKDKDGNILSTYRNKVICLAPTLSFMREVVSRAFILRYDAFKDKCYKYKLPRYYYEKLFPKNSAIRKAFADVLQILSDENLSRKLAVISSNWPNETPSQIYHRYLVQTSYANTCRENKAIQYVRKRYGKSIL